MAKFDLNLVRHALSVARQNGFAEVELNVGGESFSAKLQPGKPVPKASATAEVAGPDPNQLVEVKSPLVGYFRDPKTPLQVGIEVKKGDLVAVVAALGIANDVEAPISGEIVEVLVEQNQPLQFGQVIARIRP